MKPTTTLRQLINNKTTTIAPGVFDGLSALLAKQAGFQAIYASGGAIARSHGLPDLGLLSLTDVTHVLTHITRAAENIPVIADADTGFHNIAETVREFTRAGVAGMHIEDQTFPKRCGHLDDKTLVSQEEMCDRIHMAKKSCVDADFVIIARTDAIAVEGFAKALTRAQAYSKAGADMIFIEAPESLEQIEKIAQEIKTPKLINMFYGGKTPLIPIKRLHELDYRLVIIPSDLQRAAIKAMQKTLVTIYRDGDSKVMEFELTTFKEREIIIGTEKYLHKDC